MRPEDTWRGDLTIRVQHERGSESPLALWWALVAIFLAAAALVVAAITLFVVTANR